MTAARLPLVALLLASGGCAARAEEATPSPPFDASQMSNRTEPSTYEEVQALVEQLSKDLASEGLVQSASGTCPSGYTCASSGKFTIIARGGGFDWNHGMALCTSAGLRPAKIADASEFTQALDLRTSMTGVRHVWLGANDRCVFSLGRADVERRIHTHGITYSYTHLSPRTSIQGHRGPVAELRQHAARAYAVGLV